MPALLDRLKAHHGDSFGWALACCAWQREVAEDVLQEAYLRVLDGRARYAGKAQPRTWFFGVIRRVAADMQRARKRRAILNLRLLGNDPCEGALAEGAAPGEQAYRDESSRQLKAAMMSLSARQREILHLVFYAELTVEEAAATLDIGVGSARTHYHRGKERLAQLLELGESHD